jgi:hypothetical protein
VKVTVGPVNWGSYPGDTLEKVLAVLIGQDHKNIKRRTPSSGDGGVDILLPEGDGWHVRQVKGFSQRLTSPQKRQIKASLASAIADPRLDRPIVRWTLSMPTDFTSGEEAWFQELVSAAPFSCDSEGAVVWDGLAARHPHVIDYYLRDGRERVERRARDLLAVAHDASRPLSPIDVAGHLGQLRWSLNRDDPHYQYEFATGSDPNGLTPKQDGAVMTAVRQLEDGSFLAITVKERYEGAIEDAPIQGRMTVRILDSERDIDLRNAVQDFRLFGSPLELPDGSLDIELDAPGGLGGSFDGGGGHIQALPLRNAMEETRIQVVHPDDGVASEVLLKTEGVTRGELGGIEVNTKDATGNLSAQFRLHPPAGDDEPTLQFNLQLSGLLGQPVKQVVELARLVSLFKPPYELKWRPRYGTGEFSSTPFEQDLSFVAPEVLALLDHLERIQDRVREIVLVPDAIDAEMMNQVAFVAELLEAGMVERRWDSFDIQLKEEADPKEVRGLMGSDGAIAIEQEWSLSLGDQEIPLGFVNQVFTARLAEIQGDDPRVIRVIPAGDNRFITRLGALHRDRAP